MTTYPELDGFKTRDIPVSVIYLDSTFNCRGPITPMSCLELSESLQVRGLKIPIMVQPRADVANLPEEYEYRIVAGHRRFTAAKYLLGWPTIPATVIENLSEEDAQLLNLVENLQRKDLTLYEQAVALRKSFPEGTSYRKMAAATNKSDGWVRLRWRIMDSPREVQSLIEQGIIKSGDLKMISYKSPEEQLAIAKEIRLSIFNAGGSKRAYKKNRLTPRQSRPLRDIDEMLTILMAKGRYPDPFRALAWAAGRLSDKELLELNE